VRFEWDEKKNRVNVRKHGLDFSDAEAVFERPVIANIDHRYDEERWVGYGRLQGIVVALAFTQPDSETVRIISMRKATRKERQRYEKEIANGLEAS
jgi:uncharacterized DUF497 family protein